MAWIPYILIAFGFLGAAYTGSLDPETLDWPKFLGFMAAGTIGVTLLKRRARAAATHHETVQAGRETLVNSLSEAVTALEEIDGQKLHGGDLRDAIDNRLRAPLSRFAEARETMIPLFGMTAYGQVMGRFASAERALNRAWSASADGYDGEAAKSLRRALETFRETHGVLAAL